MTNSLSYDKSGKKVQKNLGEVFCDIKTHKEVASIIRKHLTNPLDIRETALNGLDLTKVEKIVDLGCGFGFFTRGLAGKVKKGTEILGIDRHSKCEQHYLNSCYETGLQGRFTSNGISEIHSLKKNSIDLVICSYALYFFPEYIKQISKILKDDGYFIAITHSYPHMVEFTSYVKNIFKEIGIETFAKLPYEELIEGFSNENGKELLAASFGNISSKTIKSNLLFRYEDYSSFEKYFRFKKSFFIPDNNIDQDRLTEIILDSLKKDMKKNGEISISKEDMIFICNQS